MVSRPTGPGAIGIALAITLLGSGAAIGQSPSPEIVADPGGCPTADAACLADALLRAADAVAAMDPTLRVEASPGFQGGQRNDSWTHYLADTVKLVDGYWSKQFDIADLPYTSVAYSVLPAGAGTVRSNCTDAKGPAMAGPDIGPFYCGIGGWLSADLYVDHGAVYVGVPALLDMAKRLSDIDPGDDFAFVSIIAHEVGHHVNRQLVDAGLYIETTATWDELGADCLAGVFANAAYYGEAGRLEAGDIAEALQIAYGFGNDLPYVQSKDPHGTHDQRVTAFTLGYDSGSVRTCLLEAWPTS